ncbi:hypothetical protein Dimus_028980 [Dionaea muscipula]
MTMLNGSRLSSLLLFPFFRCTSHEWLSSTLYLQLCYQFHPYGKAFERNWAYDTYSTWQGINGKVIPTGVTKMSLAETLASVVIESSTNEDKKPQTRMQQRRSFELCIKKRVKEQYVNGKFHELMMNVVANPKTLEDAYNFIRVDSNVDESSPDGSMSFESLAEELSNGSFDIKANTFLVSTRGSRKESLVLPNARLKVVQEALRIVMEIVFKPHFSKISHGGRNGRGHSSALKYIRQEISNPDWWFTLHLNKKVDDQVLDRLILAMEDKIDDPFLYSIIRRMFDAQVLNLEFGSFTKCVGLPQEGVLSPILMNIYLDLFDREFYRMSMRYEVLGLASQVVENGPQSTLRAWFRRHLKGGNRNSVDEEKPALRIYACRFMDEIFFAVGGSKDAAFALRSEVQTYLREFLHLDVDGTEVIPCNGARGVRFLGILIKRTITGSPRVKAVHKMKEKVKLFAEHKQQIWQEGMVRIGKKWLAHGLRKVKESEIKHLAGSSSLLSGISSYRKKGMETDHWYKQLVKIWMQGTSVKATPSEDLILVRCIAEPALPLGLRDSFYKFQKCAEQYIISETEALRSLHHSCSSSEQFDVITKVLAPVNVIKKRLFRYGLTNAEGYARPSSLLILQDSSQIIDWFSGIVCRWLRWYRDCDNFEEVKLIISDQVRKSCIRTLALKFRIHETEIEKRFYSELSRIPSTHDVEDEMMKEMDSLALHDYMVSYSGLILLSLARIISPSQHCNCFIFGCSAPAPCVYKIHVMERQRFPGWKTGFSGCIHPSLNKREIGLCEHHLKDLSLSYISLQSIYFGSGKGTQV